MDFFTAQDVARRRTKWLVLWFGLAVIAMVALVNVIVLFTLGSDPQLQFITSILTAGIILVASGFKSMQLSSGGAVVANDLGGRLVMPGSADFQERKLLNIVEEMAIASGMPVPQVYLMDQEEGINAFAAGTEPSNAVIGVTRGCLQRLSRDELAGVIAHEFSHILNGDMRLNMRLMGLVFGLLILSMIGRILVDVLKYQSFSSRRNSKEGGGLLIAFFLIGLGLMIIGGLGMFFGRLIQAAISRQREFLADASAVQFTRNPDGIAGALKKIGGVKNGASVVSAKASEASHMFFSSTGLFSFGLATHPPLALRIKAIQKNWDGKFLASEIEPVASTRQDSVQKDRQAQGGTMIPGFEFPSASMVAGLDGGHTIESVNLEAGEQLLHGIDHQLRVAATDREEAQGLIFGLLLSREAPLREKQLAAMVDFAGRDASELAHRWSERIGEMHSARKIALVDLSLPTLRGLSFQEYQRFRESTRMLILSDGRVDLFEFMIQKIIERHLGSHFEGGRSARIKYNHFKQLAKEANLLVSTMAELGAGSEQEAISAYQAATAPWGGHYQRKGTVSLDELGKALDSFDLASPTLKKELLESCGRAVATDGDLANREAEFLRAIADAIGCPIPLIISQLRETEN